MISLVVENWAVQVVPSERAGRSGGQNNGAGAAVDTDLPRSEGHSHAASQFGRGKRQSARIGAGQNGRLRHGVSRRPHQRSRNSRSSSQSSPLRGKILFSLQIQNKINSIFFPHFFI